MLCASVSCVGSPYQPPAGGRTTKAMSWKEIPVTPESADVVTICAIVVSANHVHPPWLSVSRSRHAKLNGLLVLVVHDEQCIGRWHRERMPVACAGVCHRLQRSLFGSALASSPVQQSCWNQRTRSAVSMAKLMSSLVANESPRGQASFRVVRCVRQ